MTTQTDLSAFFTSIWRPEHCDPKNWKYKPSTYGIKGAHKVGEPHMMLAKDIDTSWHNPGRKEKFSHFRSNLIKEDIIENGINLEEGRVIYVDVDGMKCMNGFNRFYLCNDKKIDIRGWMIQLMRYDDEISRILHANKSNVQKVIAHNNPKKEDVEAAVQDIASRLNNPDRDEIRDIINDLGEHLNTRQRGEILQTLMLDLTMNNKVSPAERYTVYGAKAMKSYADKWSDGDEWFEDYYNNEDEEVFNISMTNIQSDQSALLKALVKATLQNKPLHLLISVSTPTGSSKETLTTKRKKVFEDYLTDLENMFMTVMKLQINNCHRYSFAWNHPDCQHRFLPQDNHNELRSGLIVPPKHWNRGFNGQG